MLRRPRLPSDRFKRCQSDPGWLLRQATQAVFPKRSSNRRVVCPKGSSPSRPGWPISYLRNALSNVSWGPLSDAVDVFLRPERHQLAIAGPDRCGFIFVAEGTGFCAPGYDAGSAFPSRRFFGQTKGPSSLPATGFSFGSSSATRVAVHPVFDMPITRIARLACGGCLRLFAKQAGLASRVATWKDARAECVYSCTGAATDFGPTRADLFWRQLPPQTNNESETVAQGWKKTPPGNSPPPRPILGRLSSWQPNYFGAASKAAAPSNLTSSLVRAIS